MSDTNISLDIIRESDDTEHWLNRICRNHDTGVRKSYQSSLMEESFVLLRRDP